MITQIGAENYTFFDGIVGSSGSSGVTTPQAMPKKKKTKEWEQETLNRFESIGMRQFYENLKYRDYYKMVEGDLVYTDLLDEDPEIIRSVKDLRKEYDIPTNLKHWDIIGEAVNIIVGEWMQVKDKFAFDTIDEVSQNEYIRDKTEQLKEFAQKSFELEMNKRLSRRGLDPLRKFDNEEEQAEYDQQLQSVLEEVFPEKIEDRMKNWKSFAAQWAEKTWLRDYQRFYMEELERDEAIDFLLTGKAPRHYLIGYDYYKPEKWSPINTFHSKDPSIKYFQDCEYAGRVMFMPHHEIVERYGHRLTHNEIELMSEAFSGKWKKGGGSYRGSLEQGKWFEDKMIPFKGADEYKVTLDFQEALGQPVGEYENLETGEKSNRWLPTINDSSNSRRDLADNLRTDYKVRTDTFQVTEVYFKSYKKYGILTYRADSGYLDTVDVDEDILDEFLKEKGITTLKNVSLKEARENPEENTLVMTYRPIVMYGLKINTSNTIGGTKEDKYIVEEMPFQIKGDSNIFDVRLPVCGAITSSMAKRMRPFQVQYNWVMNQNVNMLEKELGAFLIYDVNFLPTEFLDLSDDGEDALVHMNNMIRELGILPIDASKQNLAEKGGTQFNTFMNHDLSFTARIQRNMELANYYKESALDQIGITPQRRGAPNQYETAEGVRVGQNASYAKTDGIFQSLLADKQRKLEIHLCVAQYCQLNNKDSGHLFRASDEELSYLKSIQEDKNFALRQISVFPVMSSAKRKEFENIKATLMQRNTMDADEMSLIKLVSSDDFMELRQAAYEARLYIEESKERQRQHEQQMMDKQIQSEKESEEKKYELEYAKLDTTLERERLKSVSEASRGVNYEDAVDMINQEADRAIQAEENNYNRSVQERKLSADLTNKINNFNLGLERINLEKEKINLKREELANNRYVATVNKN